MRTLLPEVPLYPKEKVMPVPDRVRLHANPDQIVGPKHLQSLLLGQGHPLYPTVMAILAGGRGWRRGWGR